MARGAEPHPARFAAFLFLNRFGGSDGRAQALPVTLRVPRSPTPIRAAAQCRSWSAVVHQARLEINMTHTASAHDLGARIIIKPLQSSAQWIGTRAQLEAEGFIPQGTKWPQGRTYTRFDTDNNWFCIQPIKSEKVQAHSVDTLYKILHYSKQPNCINRQIVSKMAEIKELMDVGSATWASALSLHWKARSDDAFQTFKRRLLGEKKRGRKLAQKCNEAQS